MQETFKLALVQMRVRGGVPDANLAEAENRIADAAAHGAQIALLPECLDAGWTHPSSSAIAAPIPEGETFKRLAGAALANGIDVCAGLTERDGDFIYNTAVYLDAGGNLLAKHRKLNELDIGHAFYAQGDRLNVVQTRFGVVGLMICADAFAHDHALSQSLCIMGADVILSPCAWAVTPGHDLRKRPYGLLWRSCYGPVAKNYSVWIAGVSNVGLIDAGPWAGHRCIGGSMVVGPDGEVVVQAPCGDDMDCIVYVSIAPLPRPARGADWNSHIHPRPPDS